MGWYRGRTEITENNALSKENEDKPSKITVPGLIFKRLIHKPGLGNIIQSPQSNQENFKS